ncbi:MAG: hypothetical protein P1U78_12485 [Alcanivoracaceae bacterium]|nr:hypothetical protein [Alcanivoracaceae bacterium]
MKLAALGAVALGSAATFVFVGGRSEVYDAGKHGRLLVLKKSNAETLLAMIQAILPQAKAADEPLHLQVMARIDEELYFVDKKIREDFCLALDVLEFLPTVLGEFSRFSTLGLSERQQFLSTTKNTRNDIVRAVIHNCRSLPMYIYYGLETSWQDIGYDGSFSKMTPLMSEQRRYYAEKVKGKSA